MATAAGRPRIATRTLVVRRVPPSAAPLLTRDELARQAGMHPELVRRLVALGAVEPAGGTHAAPLFPDDAPARLARIARLRRDLGVGIGGAMLACDLLARIDQLEARLRQYEPPDRRRAR
jgi:hypothetical protein